MSRTFSVHNLFSFASRQKCLENFKKIRMLNFYMKNAVTPNAAVLLPLCSVNDQTSLLFTVRASSLSSQGGHISFPGGKMEEGETPILTAVREAQEEIGLSATRVDVWGEGAAIPGGDGKTRVIPVVCTIEDLKQEDLNINTKEVAEVFTVPVEMLCDPRNQYYTQFKNGHILPVFVADQYKIWGLTGYLTHAFLSSLLPNDVYRNEWSKRKIELKDIAIEN